METRFVRKEMVLLRWLSAFMSELFYFKDDMQPRLGMIEDGPARLDKIIEETTAILKEMLKTGPENQRMQFGNSLSDYKVELVPKYKPTSTKVVMSPELVKTLIDFAQERCKLCVEDSKSAQKCELYKLLEAVVTPDSYDSMLCPYARAEWEE